jgi:hypothetical protein
MTRPRDVEGPATDSTRGPAQEVVDAARASRDSTNDLSIDAANVPVKPRSPLPVVRPVLVVDLAHLVQDGGWLPDKARHAAYVAAVGLTPGMVVRLLLGRAKSWPDGVVRYCAWWLSSASVVQIEGSDGLGVARFTEEFAAAQAHQRTEAAA